MFGKRQAAGLLWNGQYSQIQLNPQSGDPNDSIGMRHFLQKTIIHLPALLCEFESEDLEIQIQYIYYI